MVKCCKYPFERIKIQWNGDVYLCCDIECKFYKVGNIYEDSFEDIWYGERAQEFRKSVFDGSYKYCDLDTCFYNNSYSLKDFEESFIKNPPYPKIVDLAYIPTCNVRCRTCRDELYVETKEHLEQYNKIFDKIVDMCKNAEEVYLDGAGEVFASSYLKSLIKTISEKYPKIKFNIVSNGLLFDEKHVKDFGLEGKLLVVDISVHASTRKTYEYIVRGGNWNVLQSNLKYLSKLKKQGILKSFRLNFVFNSLNFREMPAFVKMARKYGAIAYFWAFRKWNNGTEMVKNYEKYTCWEPNHPDYKDFVKILEKLKSMKDYVFYEEYFREFQKSIKVKISLWNSLISKIFK